MAAKYVQDMTEGNEVSLIIKLTLPMLVGNVFQQFYNLIDSIVVGKYVGANALAAVGACGSLNFLFFSVCMGLSIGVGIIISQYFGARREGQVKRAIANAIYVIGAAGRIGFSTSLAMLPFLGVWSVWVTSGLTWTITAIAEKNHPSL